jgi:sn-glycerol 3-phosphate transport system substrate-binding protein
MRPQSNYRIVPEYKGQYTQTMTAALFRGPHTGSIRRSCRVNEMATATMMAAKGDDLSGASADARAGRAVRPQGLSAGGSPGYYTDAAGNMLSYRSTPRRRSSTTTRTSSASPGSIPRPAAHWPEVEAAAQKTAGAGVPCGFSTAWPSWVHLENLSAVHDVPIATRQNGFSGLDTELTISNDVVVRHVTALAALAEGEDLRLWRARGPRRREIHGSQWHVRHLVGDPPRHPGQAKFEVGYGLMP